jgi:hypothetical protein
MGSCTILINKGLVIFVKGLTDVHECSGFVLQELGVLVNIEDDFDMFLSACIRDVEFLYGSATWKSSWGGKGYGTPSRIVEHSYQMGRDCCDCRDWDNRGNLCPFDTGLLDGVPYCGTMEETRHHKCKRKESRRLSQVVFNIDKNTKFLKDEATALMYICQSLEEDHQSLIDEYTAAHDLWAYLKQKYSRNTYVTKIQTFAFGDESTIIGA